VKIGNKGIGGDNPCFVIAEVGINHNGSLDIAKKLIDAAAEAGCGAIKFQVFKTEHLYPKTAGKLDWKDKEGKYSYDVYEASKSFEMPREWIPKLMSHCKERGLIFLASVFDEESADTLERAGVPAFKIASSTITHLPLIDHIAKKKKPLILSTGGAYLEEVEDAVRTVGRYHDEIAVMHCISKYPAPLRYCNLRVLDTLRSAFPSSVVGYSDHTEDPEKAPVAAVARGAKILEKHITLDKNMEGPDHFFALEPDELKKMVAAVRNTEERLKRGEEIEVSEELLGSPEVHPYDIEEYMRKFTHRRIFAREDIRKGQVLTKENLAVLRPGGIEGGLEPKYYETLIEKGFMAARDIKEGQPINREDLVEKVA